MLNKARVAFRYLRRCGFQPHPTVCRYVEHRSLRACGGVVAPPRRVRARCWWLRVLVLVACTQVMKAKRRWTCCGHLCCSILRFLFVPSVSSRIPRYVLSHYSPAFGRVSCSILVIRLWLNRSPNHSVESNARQFSNVLRQRCPFPRHACLRMVGLRVSSSACVLGRAEHPERSLGSARAASRERCCFTYRLIPS